MSTNASSRPVRVTASAVVSAGPATVRSVNVGVAASGGTLKLHDCTTTGAAATGNQIATLALDTAQSWHFEDCYFSTGIVAIISGTTDITVIVA